MQIPEPQNSRPFRGALWDAGDIIQSLVHDVFSKFFSSSPEKIYFISL